MAAALKADIYFARPYHSWERELNENSNGLLRQYFPKGMELVNITNEQVLAAVEKLNHRSRKVLGFRTAYEVFIGVKVRYAKQPSVTTASVRTSRWETRHPMSSIEQRQMAAQ